MLYVIVMVGCGGENGRERGNSYTRLEGVPFLLPIEHDFSTSSIFFDVSLTEAEEANGTVSIVLDAGMGVTNTVSSFNDLRELVGVINAQIFSPLPPEVNIGIFAEGVDLGNGTFQITFVAQEPGFSSVIRISDESGSASEIGLSSSLVSIPGELR
ncbi:MAG: hypothetical protein K6L81_15625 [Agarilytica sp.]